MIASCWVYPLGRFAQVDLIRMDVISPAMHVTWDDIEVVHPDDPRIGVPSSEEDSGPCDDDVRMNPFSHLNRYTNEESM